MRSIRDHGDNPSGLSTHDPMRDPAYRRVAREVSDAFRRRKGIPPLPRVGEEARIDKGPGDDRPRRPEREKEDGRFDPMGA